MDLVIQIELIWEIGRDTRPLDTQISVFTDSLICLVAEIQIRKNIDKALLKPQPTAGWLSLASRLKDDWRTKLLSKFRGQIISTSKARSRIAYKIKDLLTHPGFCKLFGVRVSSTFYYFVLDSEAVPHLVTNMAGQNFLSSVLCLNSSGKLYLESFQHFVSDKPVQKKCPSGLYSVLSSCNWF